MKNEALERPVITEFMGDGFTLNKAHKQYLENLELWNYVHALDKYCDELEKLQSVGKPDADTASACNLQNVNNCLDKEHMRTIFEQSRATKADFESWYKFNYPNCC